MYPTLGGRDEPGAGDAQMALNLLYKSFINDIRVFSCSSKPMSQKNMDNVAPSSLAGWKLRSLKEEPPGNPALWTVSSSYGYSPGHRQEDGQVIVLADHQGGGANSDNHGFNKGQNCLAAAGNVEFKDSPVNKVGTDEKSGEALMDLDIYKRGGVSPAGKVEMDSYCR